MRNQAAAARPAATGTPVTLGAAPCEGTLEAALEAAEPAASVADEAAELAALAAEEAADAIEPVADARADEADSAIEDKAELSSEAIEEAALEAALAADSVSAPELYTVLKPEVVVSTLPSELVTVATRGTVVIADWSALPVAEDPPDAVPVASVALAVVEVRMDNAGGVVAEPVAEETTPRIESVSNSVLRQTRLTLTEASGVANSLVSLLRRASLTGAVADTVGPVGFIAVARGVASSTTELRVSDAVHVVDTQLLEHVRTECICCGIAIKQRWCEYILRKNQGTERWHRQQRQQGGRMTASSW